MGGRQENRFTSSDSVRQRGETCALVSHGHPAGPRRTTVPSCVHTRWSWRQPLEPCSSPAVVRTPSRRWSRHRSPSRRTRRSPTRPIRSDLGEYGGVTYLGAKNQDGRTCIIFYATSEPDRPVEGCDASDVATASISTLGEATLHSQGVKRSDESTGQQVSDWLVIQAFPPS